MQELNQKMLEPKSSNGKDGCLTNLQPLRTRRTRRGTSPMVELENSSVSDQNKRDRKQKQKVGNFRAVEGLVGGSKSAPLTGKPTRTERNRRYLEIYKGWPYER